jgi:hypothetical protein
MLGDTRNRASSMSMICCSSPSKVSPVGYGHGGIMGVWSRPDFADAKRLFLPRECQLPLMPSSLSSVF